MSCYHPIRAFRTPEGVVFQELSRYDIIGRVDLPCGMCIGCRMRRASDWELRVMHEASLFERNCFVTLTYAPGNLPAGGSLRHRDFQLFMKRARKYFSSVSEASVKTAPAAVSNAYGKSKSEYLIRYYMCGEYGPLNLRPHYHACLFNVDFRGDRVVSGKSASGAVFYDSPLLSKLWSHGRVSVQDLTRETASYCARYIMKKVLGDAAEKAYTRVDANGVEYSVEPEYAAMSLKPGIGADWFRRFGRDVFPRDYVIQDGVKRTPPKYYDKLFERGGLGERYGDQVEFAREERAKAAFADNSPERLQVREAVHNARVQTLARNL